MTATAKDEPPAKTGMTGAERQTRLTRPLEIPKYPLWLKILAFALGFLFVWLFITWAIWAMETVVMPRVQGRSPGQVTQPQSR